MKTVAGAFAIFQRGDLAGAQALLAEILERAPENADALHLMGAVHHAQGDLTGAEGFFGRAQTLSPYDAEIAFNRAANLSAIGRHADCIEVCSAFLHLRPGDPEALLLRGASRAALGKYAEALGDYDNTHLDRADVHVRRAASLLQLNRALEALEAATRARDLNPRLADAHYHRGAALGAVERWPEALEALDAAAALAPNNVPTLAARAPALANVGRFDEALRDIDAALARTPERTEYLARRAYILSAANRHAEALAAYDHVLARAPHDAASLYAKCDLLLSGGDFRRGLPLYEVCDRQRVSFAQPSAAPIWQGEPLDGKTILVQGEQGFGDLFQLCRFIPELAARGAKVVLHEREQTRGLMRCLSGVAAFVGAHEPAPHADFRVQLASLMLRLDVRLDTIPAPIPYLRAEPARVTRWRERLGVGQRRRIGIAWSGVTRHAMQLWRTLDDDALSALAGADADFVSLQMEASAIATARGVAQFGRDIADFAELAALVETLDLVVSIDTGVAHLAGALGKPVYLMLPFRADWRWLRDRADTPWYPNMRLFRQPRFGDWRSVISDVHVALHE